MESQKIWKMRELKLSLLQREFLVGTILGDGCLLKTTRGYCLRIHQGIKQKNYVEWKYQIMKNLVNTSPKISHNGYYFRTVSNPEFDKYRKLFYHNNKKVVPDNIRKLLSSFGIAVWIMDDGSRDRGCIRISTHCFDYKDQMKLKLALEYNFGIKVNIQKAKDKFWIWVRAESIPTLIKLVKPYFLSELLYKLPRNDYLVFSKN